jgi:hypothetical protein
LIVGENYKRSPQRAFCGEHLIISNLKNILNHQVKVCGYTEHKFSGGISFPTLDGSDGSGGKSSLVGNVLLGGTTIFPEFFDIVDDSH